MHRRRFLTGLGAAGLGAALAPASTGAGPLERTFEDARPLDLRITDLKTFRVDAGNVDVLMHTGAIQAGGAGSSAVFATAAAADVAIVVDGQVTAAQAWAIDASASGGAVTLDVQSGQVVLGGVRLHSQDGSRVDIHGEIVGSGDHALSISGGAATINNFSNTIIGSVQLTAGDDVFNNMGTWRASGVSDFGGGSNHLVNSGLLVASGSAPVAFSGLDTFVNEGTIDLANGVSGDRLEMEGVAFSAGAGSTLLMDVDFATGTSDTLAVQSVQGTSLIVVSDASTGAGFNVDGISLVESEQPLTGTEFALDLGTVGEGLVTYGLEFDPASNSFVVQALPGATSFELIKAGAAAQDFWLRSAEAWTSRLLAARDGAAAGTAQPGDGVWIQGHAGGLDFSNSGRFELAGGTVDRDMSTESGWTGVQAGYDRVWQTGAGHMLAGATAGYTNYSLDFTSSAGRYELSGANVGIHGALWHGRFFAGGLVKFDRFSGDLRTSQASLGGDVKGNSHGARIEAGLRFGDGFWIEPVAGITWTRSRLDDFHAGQAQASFESATSLQSRVGLRAGGSTVVSGATLVPSLAVYAIDERRGQNATVLRMGNGDNRAIDTPHGDYARAEAALTLVAGNVELFLRGGADFGSGTDGFDARAGLRWAW